MSPTLLRNKRVTLVTSSPRRSARNCLSVECGGRVLTLHALSVGSYSDAEFVLCQQSLFQSQVNNIIVGLFLCFLPTPDANLLRRVYCNGAGEIRT